MIKLLEGMVTVGEGNISMFPNRIRKLRNILIAYPPEYIVEIGFNLGHSLKLIIDTLKEKNPNLCEYKGIKKIYVFDICEGTNNGIGGNHSYVKPNFNIMKEFYNDIEMYLIEGDSLETVKPFLDSLEHDIDFVEIDGYHEGDVCKKDIDNTIGKLKSGGVIYIDDYRTGYASIDNAILTTDWSGFDIYPDYEVFIAIKK